MKNALLAHRTLLASGLVMLSALILSVGVLSTPTSAADCKSGYGLGLKTATERLTFEPNTEIKRAVEVKNEGCDAINFHVEATPFSPSGNDYSWDYDTPNKWSQIYRYISFEKTEYSLASGESVNVPYAISVPGNDVLAAGGQYAAIAIVGEKTTDGSGVNIIPRLMYQVVGRMSGDAIDAPVITEQSIPFFSTGKAPQDCSDDDVNCGAFVTRYAVKNDGNVDFSATGTIKVKGLFGGTVYETPEKLAPHIFAFPETTPPTKVVVWKDARIGLFWVEQSVTINGKATTKSSLVLIAPVWLVIVMIIGLLALAFLIVFNVIIRPRRKVMRRR